MAIITNEYNKLCNYRYFSQYFLKTTNNSIGNTLQHIT